MPWLLTAAAVGWWSSPEHATCDLNSARVTVVCLCLWWSQPHRDVTGSYRLLVSALAYGAIFRHLLKPRGAPSTACWSQALDFLSDHAWADTSSEDTA